MKGTVDELTSTEGDQVCASRQSVGPDGLSFRSEPGPLRLEDCGTGSRYVPHSLKLVLSCGGLWCYWHQRRKEEKMGEEKIHQVRQDC